MRSSWTEKVVYSFTGGNDGAGPASDVTFDKSGNLYGTAAGGGKDGVGVVYELTPSGSGWQENPIYSFTGGSDSNTPNAGLIFDTSGNLFGATLGEVYSGAMPWGLERWQGGHDLHFITFGCYRR